MDFSKLLSHSTKKPQSVLKIVLGFSAALLVMWLFMVSRMETPTNTIVVAQQDSLSIQRTESIRALTGSLPDSTQVSASETRIVPQKEKKGMFQNAFITFVVMMSLLGGIWMWARKKGTGNASKQDLREMGEYVLGQGSQLKFVEINNEVWVLGLTPTSLNLLHRVPREEWQEDQINKPDIVSEPRDFKSIYKLFNN